MLFIGIVLLVISTWFQIAPPMLGEGGGVSGGPNAEDMLFGC